MKKNIRCLKQWLLLFSGRIRHKSLLTVILALIIMYAPSQAATTAVTLKMSATFSEVLEKIEKETGYHFIVKYDEDFLNKAVNINYSNESIEEILDDLLAGTGYDYTIVDQYVAITKLSATSSSQQSKTVEGNVLNNTGNPIPGATVLEKGTENGTITDASGHFVLNDVGANATLVISFIGMTTKEININGQTSIDVTLEEESIGLDEVVAIGYGSVSIKDATGAISAVRSEDFNKGVVTSPEQLIQGRTAGVQITASSGEPGASININIRGTSSVRSGNNPLFVVDGVPLSGDNVSPEGADVSFGGSTARNPLNFLNPDDIKDIVILKDASATAIYGSRGANGVVIITTKGGGYKGDAIEYSYSTGVSTVSKSYDVLDAQEYLDAIDNYGGNSSALDAGESTDWQDQIYRTAISQNHNFSYGNSDQRGNYRVSLSYLDQEGIIKESRLERYTVRVNGNRNFFENRLKFESQFSISNIKDSGVPIGNSPNHFGDLLASALYMNPTEPVKTEDGEYNQPSFEQLNPVAMLAYSNDNTNTLRALVSLSAELKLTPDLSIKTVYGNDLSKSERRYAYSPLLNANYIVDNGKAGILSIGRNNNTWENFLTYNKTFSSLELTALLGYSYQSFERQVAITNGGKFRFDDTQLMMNNLASGESIVADSNLEKDELQSYFTRWNLSLADKFLFTATMRADGSTKFGGNNQYGYFPSVALGYRLSEENFIPQSINNLKIRLGWGITGNQEIPHNLYSQRQRYGISSIDGDGEIDLGSLGNVTFANPDLKWETTSQINAGIDFGFAGGRVNGSVDFYRKKTTDLLLRLSSAQPAPQSYYWTNMDGNIYNTGVELGLSVNAVQTGNFNWDISANTSYNKNIVKDLSTNIETGVLDGQGLSGVTIQRITNDYPMYTYYLRKFEGFDNDGIAVYDGDYPQYTGDSPIPKVTAGLTNTLRYKNFDLNIYLNGQFGHKIYSNTANAFFYAGNLANGRNVTKDIVGNGESPLNTADPSTRFLESGDFVRLQDVTLGYNIPVKNSDYLSNIRLYVTGQNLAVFTSYSGQDPEVNVNKGSNGVPSLGIDYTTYPRSRTILAGVKVTF